MSELSPSDEGPSLAASRSWTLARIVIRRFVPQLSAVIAVVLALLLRVALARQRITLPTYITFYPAVILAALLGGMWTGIFATALSALLVAYWVLAPVKQFSVQEFSDIVAMVIFCLSGVFISVITELYHRNREKLATYRLEEAVRSERRKVDEARELAESIRAERQRFLDVLETLPTMISLLTPDHRIAFANRSYREKFGECLDQTCYEGRFGRTAPCEHCETYSVLDCGQPHHWEVIFPDGSLVDAYDFPFTDLDGSSLILEMKVDITERRRAEIELEGYRKNLESLIAERTDQLRTVNLQLRADVRERERAESALEATLQRFYMILSNMNSGVLLVTDEGRIEFANQTFCDLFGLSESPAELMESFDSEKMIGRIETVYQHSAGAARRIGEIVKRGETVLNEEILMLAGKTYLRDFVPLTAIGKSFGRMWVHTDITKRKGAEAALLQSEKMAFQRQQLQALAKRLRQVREEERKMVARDLHDQIGQILTAIKMDMSWVVRHLPNSEDKLHERLAGSIELINDGVRSVRKICSGLRPGILDDLGLAAAIEWQANEFASRTAISCQVSLPAAELYLDGDRATEIFRIFQECLTNVARHAEARSVRVSLRVKEEDLLLAVEDDGKGFRESDVKGSLGVLGMKERAKVCGGDVTVASSPGKGTTVTVRIPMHTVSAECEDHAYSDSR